MIFEQVEEVEEDPISLEVEVEVSETVDSVEPKDS